MNEVFRTLPLVLLVSSVAIAGDPAELAKGLADADGAKREAAAKSLAELGPDALPALEALLGVTTDKLYKVRVAAVEAIGAIGPKAKPGAGARLVELLTDRSAQVREVAASALGSLGPDEAAVKALAGVLGDDKWRVRVAALGSLERAGAVAAPALGAVEALVKEDKSASVRAAAEKCRAAIASAKDAVKEAPTPTPEPTPEPMEAPAATPAPEKAPPAETSSEDVMWKGHALSKLRATLAGENLNAAHEAMEVVQAMGPLGGPALAELRPLLGHADPAVRKHACATVGKLGEAGGVATPELRKLLTGDDPKLAEAAARAISRIGPSAKDAVPDLIAAWKADVDHQQLCRAFQAIGAPAADARELLVAALAAGKRPSELQDPARALAALGKPGFEALLVFSQDASKNLHLRTAALEAAGTARGSEDAALAHGLELLAKGDDLDSQLLGYALIRELTAWSPKVLTKLDALKALLDGAKSRDAKEMTYASHSAASRAKAFLEAVGDPLREEAIPALVKRLDAGEDDARPWLERHAERSTRVIAALRAHLGERAEGQAYRLLCRLTGRKVTSSGPPKEESPERR